MNDELQAELRAMRDQQRALREQLGAFDARLTRFETQAVEVPPPVDAPVAMTEPVVSVVPVAPVVEAVPVAPVLPVPPVIEPAPAAPAVPVMRPSVPPPLPPPPPLPALPMLAEEAVSLDDIAAGAGWRARKPSNLPPPVPGGPPVAGTPPPLRPPETSASTPPTAKPDSLEMRIGSVWLVRAGVVLVLTALVFAGSALYQNVIPRLGPAGKLGLLYLGAGALTGVGAWLERSRQTRENPRLKNYAQVLFAGGLAAIYYVTYAAHYIDRLRVIESAVMAGAALLVWTVCMVGLAHRRNSETLATVAILLAFYTSAINEGVAGLTLFSNLALTGGTVFLLRRHLWRVFPFASLLATFGSYGYWTYHAAILNLPEPGLPPVHGHHGPGGFWIEAAFLSIYWALFTWVAFTAEDGVLPSFRRASFVSLNNSAYFLLTTWLVVGQGPGWFWKWSLGFGLMLVALAEACRRLPRPADRKTEDAYLLQGVSLVTLAFVAYFDGWQLSTVLAVQSLVLLAATGRRVNVWLLVCSMFTALLAFGFTMGFFASRLGEGEWLTPLAVGGFLVIAAYLAQRLREAPTAEVELSRAYRGLLSAAPSYYSLLGCAVWFVLICNRFAATDRGILVLIGTAFLLTASVYFTRIKALAIYAQAFLAMGCLMWAAVSLFPYSTDRALNVWTTLGPLAGALALGHWWQRLPGIARWSARWTAGGTSRTFSALDAVGAVGVVFAWFIGHYWSEAHRASGFMAAGTSGLTLVVLAYAAATRYRALAVASQGLLLVGVVFFLDLCGHTWTGSGLEVLLASVPFLVVILMLAGTRYVLPSESVTPGLRVVGYFYEGLALVMFLVWTGHYLPSETLMPVYMLAGTALFALGVERQVRRWLFLSIVPTMIGLFCFFGATGETRASWVMVPGIILLAAQQQIGQRRLGVRLPTWFPVGWQNAIMVAGTLCAWIFVTAKASSWYGSAFTLSASWSIFAAVVFAAGLLLRERIYRWAGLIVMGVTFGRLAIFDIMRLDSTGKAISFFALAVVLLAVGFLYNKFQSKFRDLL